MRVVFVLLAAAGLAGAVLFACSSSNGTGQDSGVGGGDDASFPDTHKQTLDAQLTKDVTAKDAAATDAHVAKDVVARDAPAVDAAPDAACSPLEATCVDPSQCCAGANCAQVGGLVEKWCCSDLDGGCGQDNDCCGDLRCGGGRTCVATCFPLQTPCNGPNDCCLGAQCAQVGGLVQDWCCAPQDGGCLEDNDCCGDLRCTGGACN
jgi:hypothetical protein